MSDETLEIVRWKTCAGIEYRLLAEHQQADQWRIELQSRKDSDEWDGHFISGACEGLNLNSGT